LEIRKVAWLGGLFHWKMEWLLESARAAHCAMIAGLATRFDAASFFFLKKVDQLRNSCFFNTKLFLTRM